MSYYFSKKSPLGFEEAIEKVTDALKNEGFGILTKIDVKETLKMKLDVDIHSYIILGACNPPFAYQALQVEDKVGIMLPCNVIVQEKENGTEISAVDPVVSMQAIDNPKLGKIAKEIRERLHKAIDTL